MRQLATTELSNVSGGSDGALLVGLGLAAVGIGMMASYPTYGYSGYAYPAYAYPTYSYPVYSYPVCDQVITPVFDPYTGAYMGDMVDTYCW